MQNIKVCYGKKHRLFRHRWTTKTCAIIL